MKNGFKILLCVLVLGLLVVSVVGKDVPTPAGDVVLTVSGVIALTNDGDTFKLDMDMLKTLPYLAYEVEDPWMGTQIYGGVELRTLLDYVGIPAGASKVVMVCSSTIRSSWPTPPTAMSFRPARADRSSWYTRTTPILRYKSSTMKISGRGT